MTIRFALCAFVLAAAFAGAASATPKWSGAGWYVVADTIDGAFVLKGPYASKEACEPNRPANEIEADYWCEYLTARPSYDE